MQDHPSKRRTVYGRRQSRPLKKDSRNLFDTLLPALLFSKDVLQQKHIWLEIGFGGGEHLCQQALAHPDVTFIGCEPFVNGVASLLKHIEKHSLGNVRIFQDDANLLLQTLGSHSMENIFLLFPDPWPKKRHYKRRFVQRATIQEIHRILTPTGSFRIATDHPDYAHWVLEQFNDPVVKDLFDQTRKDIYSRPGYLEWPETRYEQKAKLAGRPAAFFSFSPKPR